MLTWISYENNGRKLCKYQCALEEPTTNSEPQKKNLPISQEEATLFMLGVLQGRSEIIDAMDRHIREKLHVFRKSLLGDEPVADR